MGQYDLKIKDWPEDERPRERLIKYGAEALSEAELLAIILRTGSGKSTAVDLSRRLLILHGGLRGIDKESIEILCQEKGIGQAKAAQVKAALEIAKRLVQQQAKVNQRINSSEDVYQLVRLRMRDLPREEFHVLFLTIRNDIILEETLFKGSLTESVVSPREIILTATRLGAAAVILLHNHPSGDPQPSNEDKNITKKIVFACKYIDLTVVDHIIIGKDSYFSFADQGVLPRTD